VTARKARRGLSILSYSPSGAGILIADSSFPSTDGLNKTRRTPRAACFTNARKVIPSAGYRIISRGGEREKERERERESGKVERRVPSANTRVPVRALVRSSFEYSNRFSACIVASQNVKSYVRRIPFAFRETVLPADMKNCAPCNWPGQSDLQFRGTIAAARLADAPGIARSERISRVRKRRIPLTLDPNFRPVASRDPRKAGK